MNVGEMDGSCELSTSGSGIAHRCIKSLNEPAADSCSCRFGQAMLKLSPSLFAEGLRSSASNL